MRAAITLTEALPFMSCHFVIEPDIDQFDPHNCWQQE